MTLTIGSITFDHVSYDRDADVLYLSVGDPERAVEFDESAEGHALRYDSDGRLVGVTIVGAGRLLESRVASSSPHPSFASTATTLPPFSPPRSGPKRAKDGSFEPRSRFSCGMYVGWRVLPSGSLSAKSLQISYGRCRTRTCGHLRVRQALYQLS